MPVTLPAGCTRARLERRISVVGVDLRTDDDPDAVTGVMEDAWVEVLGYCRPLYSETELGGSEWILMRWTDLAVMLLCERRNNPASMAATRKYEKAILDLEKVQVGAITVPDAALEKSTAPVLTNQRVRTWPFPHVVNERSQSTGNPEDYRANDDPVDIDPIP